MSQARRPAAAALIGLALCGGSLAAAAPGPRAGRSAAEVVISLASATLRLEERLSDGRLRRRVFPVGVGRTTPDGRAPPRGLHRTGPDPRDPGFYVRARTEPAFHGGLPFLRLDIPVLRTGGVASRPYGVHGPITPTLIWGRISAGCVRMRPADIRALYGVAVAHPRMPVRFVSTPDPFLAELAADPRDPDCPEAAVGVRPLERLRADGDPVPGRVCGGVDHWYATPLQGGDVIAVELGHGGALRVELYGIRAISTVARGVFGLRHRVPMAPRNRGERYLRIVAPAAAGSALPFTLRLRRL